MILLDSNVIIYIANGTLDTSVIADYDVAYASVTAIETLGYKSLRVSEEVRIAAILETAFSVELSQDVVERAIKIRQLKTIGLGDAIIAATAFVHDLELWTANTNDFEHIDGLKLHNPLAN